MTLKKWLILICMINRLDSFDLFESRNSDSLLIDRVIGCIEFEDSRKMHSVPVFFNGQVLSIDREGFFSFPCSDFKVNEPLYLLVSTGSYPASRLEALDTKTFKIKTIKLGLNKVGKRKDYLFFIIRVLDNKVIFDLNNDFFKDNAYEIPSDKTILLGVSPKYFLDFVPQKISFVEESKTIYLPSIVLQNPNSIKRNKNHKFSWRKLKLYSSHEKVSSKCIKKGIEPKKDLSFFSQPKSQKRSEVRLSITY